MVILCFCSLCMTIIVEIHIGVDPGNQFMLWNCSHPRFLIVMFNGFQFVLRPSTHIVNLSLSICLSC